MKKLAISMIILILGLSAYSQTDIPKAQSMFIYNFCRFVEWPQSAGGGQFIIGVLGGNDMVSALTDYTAGKLVGMKPITVKQYKSPADIENCQILFVAYGKCGAMKEIVDKIGSNPTLIVAEKRSALTEGAAITFVLMDDKLKFELNKANATKNGLKLNTKLEEMAYASK